MSPPLKCSRCGAVVPENTRDARPPASAATRPTRWLVAAAMALVAIALAVLIPVLIQQSRKRADDRYWLENYDNLLALKGEAENLAISGNLPQAHALYRQIERLVGGRSPADPRLWDLTERAKQDQDRIYATLMTAALPPPTKPTPQAQYRALDNNTSTPTPTTRRYLSSTRPGSLLAAATQALAATPPPPTRPPLAAADPPAANPPANVPPTPSLAPDLADTQIGQAIQRGADFIIKHFEADQIALQGKPNDAYLEGLNALCVYALLQAGQAVRDDRLDVKGPFIRNLLARLKEHTYAVDSLNVRGPVTYARSLRALALSVYRRPEDRQTLQDDVEWLVLAATDGAYTYNDRLGRIYKDDKLGRFVAPDRNRKTLYYFDPQQAARDIPLHNGEWRVPTPPPTPGKTQPQPRPVAPGLYRPGTYRLADAYRNRLYQEAPDAIWDNSNTQYGLLGVWAGAEAGVEVPIDYWMGSEKHWINCQLPTGQWKYDGSPLSRPTYAMTVAGIASLFVTHDYLDAPALGADVGREPFSQSLARGLAWLEKADNCVDVMAGGIQYLGYNLFSLERVGLASGFKYFGAHDWYRELAAKALLLQRPDGSWCRELTVAEQPEDAQADALVDTAFVLLFLARGRHPVMINKLRFDGYWNNRARDIANLSTFAGRELERPLNWQVVTLASDWFDWMDSPILYIASHQAPKLTDEHYQKLRSFAEAGGLIFTHADAASPAFNAFAADLAKKLFPDFPMTNLPSNHDVYSLLYKLAAKPPLRAVSNGSRLLLVHSPTDFSTAWQVRNGTKREPWDLAVNLFVYAAGKGDLRNRLSSPYIPPVLTRPATRLRLTRLKYPAAWNPEPHAWERFSRYLQQQSDIGLDLFTSELKDLKPTASPIAHLTGNVPYTATDPETQALRQYVEAGGVLLIDSCGGSERFAPSVAALLQKLAPTQKPTLMDFKHRLFTPALPAMDDLTRPQLRPYAKLPPQFLTLSIGKGKVISTPLDLTTGLLGTNTWCISGYQPDYSQKFLKNLILWTSDGAKD